MGCHHCMNQETDVASVSLGVVSFVVKFGRYLIYKRIEGLKQRG